MHGGFGQVASPPRSKREADEACRFDSCTLRHVAESRGRLRRSRDSLHGCPVVSRRLYYGAPSSIYQEPGTRNERPETQKGGDHDDGPDRQGRTDPPAPAVRGAFGQGPRAVRTDRAGPPDGGRGGLLSGVPPARIGVLRRDGTDPRNGPGSDALRVRMRSPFARRLALRLTASRFGQGRCRDGDGGEGRHESPP